MRYGVDGKADESGARLGAIGRDHLGELNCTRPTDARSLRLVEEVVAVT
jgi:hypothetical protein